MKQKLALCCALIHKPDVLFLDEPTTGVDPVSRKEFWEMLERLKRQHITIIVSTPYMDEATLCDKIALMQSGKILSIDTPVDIIRSYPGNLYKIKSDRIYQLLKDLNNYAYTLSCYIFGEYLHLSLTNDDEQTKKALVKYLQDNGHRNIEFYPVTPSIEDCFIKLLKN